jgi:hypothetical protein
LVKADDLLDCFVLPYDEPPEACFEPLRFKTYLGRIQGDVCSCHVVSFSTLALNSAILPFSSTKFAADINVVTVESSALTIVTQLPPPPNNFTTEVSLSSFALRCAAASTVLATALMVDCSSWTKQAPEEMKAANERKAAPDFTLSDAKSARVKLSDYKGKVVLLNFWAT